MNPVKSRWGIIIISILFFVVIVFVLVLNYLVFLRPLRENVNGMKLNLQDIEREINDIKRSQTTNRSCTLDMASALDYSNRVEIISKGSYGERNDLINKLL